MTLSTQQLSALASEVQTDPQHLGYAAHLPDAPGMVCDLLNAITAQMVKSRVVCARTVLAECGSGAGALLDKLDSIGASNPSVKWAVKFLQQEGGLDVGHPVTQSMLDQLVTAGALLTAEATSLKNLALQPCSRAETLGFGRIEEADLRAAGVI